MAYADVSAVTARAGALSGAWTSSSTPSTSDLAGFLDDVAAEIDAVLSARGLTPPDAGSAAANALRGVNADGALVLALEATFPEAEGPASASGLLEKASSRYEEARDALAKGTHPAVALLEAGGPAPSASALALDQPALGRDLNIFDPLAWNASPFPEDQSPSLAPLVRKNMPL